MSGAYGLAVAYPKKAANIGTLIRSAFILDASAVYIVGARYTGQPSDTLKADRHIPVMHFDDWPSLFSALPRGWQPVAVECRGAPLATFVHPSRCVYILGPEDGDIPPEALSHCKSTVTIPGDYCLNVSVAASIVMYDRTVKRPRRTPTPTLD